MSSGEDNTISITINAETIRDHLHGSPWPEDQAVAALPDVMLDEAGALAVNQRDDLFWAAVDNLYASAVSAARRLAQTAT
jgi:hypothetical protein